MARSRLLTPGEARLWHAWQSLSEGILAAVAHDVSEASGLSAPDYRVLASLIELGNGRLRQRELAIALGWDKSRTSHQLTRMHERELLTRSKSVSDGSRVEITALGRETFARARPAHAGAVRRHLIERLTPEQATMLVALGRVGAPERARVNHA
jgi:DNA-binding MarR family transcriptional regulator